MSTETIGAVLPRAPNGALRPAGWFEPGGDARAEAPAHLERLQAAFPGEGHREEDAGTDGRDARSRTDPRPQPVAYPPAGPSLPPPLVPIREVPPLEEILPEQILPELLVERAVERGSLPGASEAEPDGALDAEGSSRTAETGREARPDPALPGAPTAEEESAETRELAAERALEKVVLSQGREASPVPRVDAEFAGEVFSIEV